MAWICCVSYFQLPKVLNAQAVNLHLSPELGVLFVEGDSILCGTDNEQLGKK